MKESNLLFLVSLPRSGSTLLQRILSSHKNIHTLPEPWLLLPLLSCYDPGIASAKYSHSHAVGAIKEFSRMSAFDELIRNFVLDVYDSAMPHGIDSGLFLDKTPRYYMILNTIKKMFPEAKIILLKRNPLDVLLSIYNTYGGHALTNHSYDLTKGPSMIHEFRNSAQFDDQCFEVRYEDITMNTEETLTKLAHFLDLDSLDVNSCFEDCSLLDSSYGDKKGFTYFAKVHKNKKEYGQLNDTEIKRLLASYSDYLGDAFLSKYGSYPSFHQKNQKEFYKLLGGCPKDC